VVALFGAVGGSDGYMTFELGLDVEKAVCVYASKVRSPFAEIKFAGSALVQDARVFRNIVGVCKVFNPAVVSSADTVTLTVLLKKSQSVSALAHTR
jgi:hypothetical protein